MILDTIDNFGHYFQGLPGLDEFLSSLKSDTPDGRHGIDGDNIFAMVSRYQTRPRPLCRPEAHEKYVDIQILVKGHETIEWFPLEGLHAADPYDPESDVAFYALPKVMGTQVALSGGMFTVFFPHDAHMPQVEAPGGPQDVIKVVIKIRAELL